MFHHCKPALPAATAHCGAAAPQLRHDPPDPAERLGAVLESAARLRHVARGILDDADLAEDAVQEAMITLWQAEAAHASTDGWLFRTVVHRSLHAGRTARRRRRHEHEAGTQAVAEGEASAADDPFEVVAQAQTADLLQSAIDALPRAQREVLLLRERSGLDYDAIAQALDLPIGTVRSRLNRTRQALRRALQDVVECPR